MSSNELIRRMGWRSEPGGMYRKRIFDAYGVELFANGGLGVTAHEFDELARAHLRRST